jgi:hypothetical protein
VAQCRARCAYRSAPGVLAFPGMKVAALVALLVASPAAARDPWTNPDTAAEAGFVAVVLLDWQQTRAALASGHVELNPIIGQHPSRARLDAMVLGGVVAHAVIARVLPQPYRRAWQYVTIGVEVAALANNAAHVGLRFGF